MRSNQSYNKRTLLRVELATNLMVSCQLIQDRVSLYTVPPIEKGNRGICKQPLRKMCILDPDPDCRYAPHVKLEYGALDCYVPS